MSEFSRSEAHRALEIGKNDEGVIGWSAIGAFIGLDRFDDEGRLRGGGERGADIEWRTVFAVVVNGEGFLRVGTFDREVAKIVGGETVGGSIDFHWVSQRLKP